MTTEEYRQLREALAAGGDDIDEIVRWQMTGLINRTAPHRRGVVSRPLCGKCHSEWHGLPKDGCPGSFDTPENDQ